MKKNFIVLAVLIILIVAATIVYLATNRNNSNLSLDKNDVFSVTKQDLKSTEMPSVMPSDLPIAPGSEVLQNYEATASDGRKQSTRVITTNQNLAVAMGVYKDFFTSKDWVSKSSTNATPGVQTIALEKGRQNVLIVARANTDTNQNTIEITLTEPVSSNQ